MALPTCWRGLLTAVGASMLGGMSEAAELTHTTTWLAWDGPPWRSTQAVAFCDVSMATPSRVMEDLLSFDDMGSSLRAAHTSPLQDNFDTGIANPFGDVKQQAETYIPTRALGSLVRRMQTPPCWVSTVAPCNPSSSTSASRTPELARYLPHAWSPTPSTPRANRVWRNAELAAIAAELIIVLKNFKDTPVSVFRFMASIRKKAGDYKDIRTTTARVGARRSRGGVCDGQEPAHASQRGRLADTHGRCAWPACGQYEGPCCVFGGIDRVNPWAAEGLRGRLCYLRFLGTFKWVQPGRPPSRLRGTNARTPNARIRLRVCGETWLHFTPHLLMHVVCRSVLAWLTSPSAVRLAQSAHMGRTCVKSACVAYLAQSHLGGFVLGVGCSCVLASASPHSHPPRLRLVRPAPQPFDTVF